eukprot:SAG31_NODE_1013_length_10376_cov_9.342220_8_plen_212_part_00
MERMDPQLTGEVGLEAFAKWWKYKQQEYRRDIRKKVREVFQLVDEDGSGVLDKGEVALLQKKVRGYFLVFVQLSEKYGTLIERYTALIEQVSALIDPEKVPKDWCAMLTSSGRNSVRATGVLKPCINVGRAAEFDPPFDLDRDFSDMDKDGEGTITYDEFEQWFKVRTGDDDPDVPVLPECTQPPHFLLVWALRSTHRDHRKAMISAMLLF